MGMKICASYKLWKGSITVLQLEAYEGELTELRKIKSIIRHNVLAERLGDTYFICGEGGAKDTNNLPERIHVCPAYGCDWFQIYERTEKSFGPEW
jgi:hypothetical protein